LGSSISVGTGTWYEYGCTFEQANISGGSGNKRVSFQRIGSTVCAGGGNTTTITLPVPLGATTYHVSATPFSANAAPPQWCVLNKMGTRFDVKVFSQIFIMLVMTKLSFFIAPGFGAPFYMHPMEHFGVLALPLILLYNGKRGYATGLAFYWFFVLQESAVLVWSIGALR
jgi:hypothetical protein